MLTKLLLAMTALLLVMFSGVAGAATLVAEYRFDDLPWCSPTSALDTAGTHHGTLINNVSRSNSPAAAPKPINGNAAGFSGGAIDITGLPLNLASGAQNAVSFWMFWDGTNGIMPIGFRLHDLWLQGGSFGFNTFNSDIYGISSAGLANGWHHVAAVFTNNNVASNQLWIDGVPQTLTQRASTPNNANATASSHMRLSGVWGTGGYAFKGMLDVVRIYSDAITQAQVDADRALSNPAVACPPPPPAALVAQYRLDDNWDATHATENAVGGGPSGNFLTPYASKVTTPAVSPNKPDTCSGAAFTTGNGSMRSTGAALNLNVGEKNSVSFWMFWNGGDSQMPFGFALYDLWLRGGSFGFNSANSDVFGISSTGLANGWHHVSAVFTNGNVPGNKLWIDGVPQALTQMRSSPNNGNAHAANTFQWSSWTNDNNYRFNGSLDELKVYRGELSDAQVQLDFAASCSTLLADWRMDEASWNGTAGEVLDSSGSYPGQAMNSANTTDGARAIAGNPGTCRYGSFDSSPAITKGYVALPNFPNFTTDFTFTAWIRTTNNAVSAQRIFIDDEKNTKGYGLSLADGGKGKLRFYARGSSKIILDTPNVIANNVWYFVAGVADITNGVRKIYVYDATANLLPGLPVSVASTGWGIDAGVASIGGETNASGESPASHHFRGNMDEVRVYGQALNQTALTAIAMQTHPCDALDHLEIQHPSGSGLTCAASTLNIRACSNAACTTLYTGGVSGTLEAAGTPSVNWDGTTGGASGAGFVIPSGSSSVTKNVQVATVGSVLFGTSAPTPVPANVSTCNFGTPACTFTANNAGFVFSNTATGTAYTIPAQVAGIATSPLFLRALQASTSNPAVCTPAIISQTTPVNMGYACNNPATCQAGNLTMINATAIAGSPNANPTQFSTPVSLTFDANGSASITARYDDVGQITLNANKTVTPFGGGTAITLNGNSNAFVVKPHHFDLSGIGQTAAPNLVNPAAADAAGAKFIKAGEGFTATVTARNALGNVTPNYGQETAAEGVKLTSALVGGLGLSNNPALGGTFGAFSNGVANGTAFTWGEVGIITLTPSVADGNYLGAGDVTGTASGHVGRFYPDHFDTEVAHACLAGSFTYSGQPFPLKVTAQNLAGATTLNYNGTFVKPVTLSDANGAAGAFAPATLTQSHFTSGVADLMATPSVQFTFTSPQTAPVTIKVHVTDGEASSGTTEGATLLRSGRLRLQNVYGSELLALPVPFEAQFWAGSFYTTNTADSCTVLPLSSMVMSSYTGGLAACETQLAPTGSVTLVSGQLPAPGLRLTRPGAGNQGSVNLAVNVSNTAVGNTCVAATESAATAANLPWFGPNLGSRATFGIYKSPLIYRRENY